MSTGKSYTTQRSEATSLALLHPKHPKNVYFFSILEMLDNKTTYSMLYDPRKPDKIFDTLMQNQDNSMFDKKIKLRIIISHENHSGAELRRFA